MAEQLDAKLGRYNAAQWDHNPVLYQIQETQAKSCDGM